MKVKELIKLLQAFDGDTEVSMSYFEPGYDGGYVYHKPAVLPRKGSRVVIVTKRASDSWKEEHGDKPFNRT